MKLTYRIALTSLLGLSLAFASGPARADRNHGRSWGHHDRREWRGNNWNRRGNRPIIRRRATIIRRTPAVRMGPWQTDIRNGQKFYYRYENGRRVNYRRDTYMVNGVRRYRYSRF